jgi:tRNA A-37 threonylcarbamoyl transferase component Bud32
LALNAADDDTRPSQVLLPVIVARLADADELADVLRTALAAKVSMLRLDEPPLGNILHALELHAPCLAEPLVVSARPIGEPVAGLVPVQLCPLDARETERIRTFLGMCTRDSDPLVGTVLGGRYHIEQLIGHGAMGSVYRAHHVTLDKPIAVKVLNPKLRNDPAFAARFLGEARAASRLDHPGILRVLDFGDESDLLYMVMELLDGHTVEEEAAHGPMDVERALDIVARVSDALGEAHDKGVVHRDIKPENVMLSGDRVVVCDFGIAQTTGRNQRLTALGDVCGTPDFMAPEQGLGGDVGPAADVYAAGILLYRLLTGNHPFSRPTPLATVLAHITDPLPAPSSLRPDLPLRVEQALYRVLAKDPAERPANGAELAALLRSCNVAQEHSPSSCAARPGVRAALIEALDSGDSLRRIQSIAGLRRLGAIDGEVVAKLAELVSPLCSEDGDLRVAAAVALGEVDASARRAAIDALNAALIPRAGGIVGIMRGDRNDGLLLETVARVLIELAGEEGRRMVAARAVRARPSVRPRLEALLALERRIA